jgi:predicted esterase
MWKSAVLALAAGALLAAHGASRAACDDLPGKPPDSGAPPLTAFGWKSLNDLRFVWWLPKDYDPQKPRNLVVICHGPRVDYRWGWFNHKPGQFRPDDVVVSVDGPSQDGENRSFSRDKKDAEVFAAFLAEMRRTFSVDRLFLYGYAQGAMFAMSFAGSHPDLVAGVVAHAAGEKNGFEIGLDPRKIAIAILNGTADADAPYAEALDRRDQYAKSGWSTLLLRRLDRCGHEPNPVRAAEALAWCQGMTASKPEEALACALELLRPKAGDAQDRPTKVAFSAARDVLRRLEKKGPSPFADVPEDVAAKAADWIKQIEDLGSAHVAAVRAGWKAKRVPKLDGGAWLGHLVPLREDFRGVDSVEAFLKEIGFDPASQAHAKAAEPLIVAWPREKEGKKLFEMTVDTIGKAYLYDGMPADLDERMQEWYRNQRKLSLSTTALKKWADYEAWKKSWSEGWAEYASVGKSWKGP